MPELPEVVWRFFVALSRRDDGVVDIVERDGTVLGSVVVQGRRLAYVAIPGDQRHLGRMLTERDPRYRDVCVAALEHARRSGMPFAAALLAEAPGAIDDVRHCLLEQSARRLLVLGEILRSQPAVAHFREVGGVGIRLELTMDFWEVWQRLLASTMRPASDDATRCFHTWQGTCVSALLLLDTGAGAVMPMARAGEVCAATPGQLDDLASAISGTLRTVDRVVAAGGSGDWSVTVRSAARTAWLRTDDDRTLNAVLGAKLEGSRH